MKFDEKYLEYINEIIEFMKQYRFDKTLLSHPMPKEMLDRLITIKQTLK